MSLLAPLLDFLRRRSSIGARGERIAARHLKQQGYRILVRNLRNRFGEIDILAEAPDHRTVVLVEVKSGAVDTSRDPHALRPELHVNKAKQRKLTALAVQTVRRYGLADRPVRFDVIGVDIPPRGKPQIRHHVGAFESLV